MNQSNVLLVVLDSVRAKNMGLYGHTKDNTPFLEEYAERSTVYTQARSPGIHSVASHASLWTGMHVEQHQVVEHEDQLEPGTTIWEELTDEGYRTGIFTTNAVVAHASNLSEPFDHVVTDDLEDTTRKLFENAHSPADVKKHEGVRGNLVRCVQDEQPVRSFLNNVHHFYLKQTNSYLRDLPTATDLVDSFLDWQRAQSGPWAACLNLMEAHFPYEPTPEYDRWGGETLRSLHSSFSKPPAYEFVGGRPWWQLEAFQHLYDGTILELDAVLRRLITSLEESGVHENTLVVVTSDHGEGFGEFSRLTGTTRMVDHSWGLHEVLTHVPLVVSYPGQTTSNEVPTISSLVEFPQTVRDVLQGEVAHDSFVADRPVVASTYRLLEANASMFDDSEEDAAEYLGPWRAVYQQSGDVVRKHITRHGASVEVEVRDAQHSYPVGLGDGELVDATFGALEPASVKQTEQRELSEAVEGRLSEIGYVR
ncbi:sulfatase [Salinigranum halophilum]|uniref:sulfatase n=1 Tax=Salinigranum halophilum TaxID=2565931 RepID=UPI0010A87716|nr:sulfatase [Salinigranum halophilum]